MPSAVYSLQPLCRIGTVKTRLELMLEKPKSDPGTDRKKYLIFFIVFLKENGWSLVLEEGR